MLTTKNVRSPRMVRRQKEELIRLVQMHFIRTDGYDVNVNGKDIDIETWKVFTTLLNTLGPPKTHDEWKTSFHYMTIRVKTKLDSTMNLCMQSGQRFDLNSFNEIDRKIIGMFYMTSLVVNNEDTSETTTNQFVYDDAKTIERDEFKDIVDSNDATVQQKSKPNDQHNVQRDFEPYESLVVADDSETMPTDIRITFVKSLCDGSISERAEYAEEKQENVVQNELSSTIDCPLQPANIAEMDNEIVQTSFFTSLYDSSLISEITEYVGAPEYQKNQYETPSQQNGRNSAEQSARGDHEGQARSVQFDRISTNSTRRVARSRKVGRARGEGRARGLVRARGTTFVRQVGRAGSARGAKSTRGIVRRGRLIRGVKKLNPNQRISITQKRRLLQLEDCNFLRIVGRFSGFNGVIIKRRIWEDYAKELNSLGPPFRNGIGWEKVFTSIRLRAKSTFATIRNQQNKIGVAVTKLSEMDERILTMFGIDQVDGHQELGEGGFSYKKTLPYHSLSQPSTESDVMDTATSIDYFDDPVALNERIEQLLAPAPMCSSTSSNTHRKNIERTSNVIEPALGNPSTSNSNDRSSQHQNGSQNNDQTGSSSTNSTNRSHNNAQPRVRTEVTSNKNANGTDRAQNRDRGESCDRDRDRNRYRNRYTSYEIVERSINAQERFIDQSNRNHNEMMHMFTIALEGFTSVLRDFFGRNDSQ